MIMGKVVPPSFPMSTVASDDIYRKSLAAKYQDLPHQDKNEQKNEPLFQDIDEETLLKVVNEVNALLCGLQQNLLVLMNNRNENKKICIINSQTHELIKDITIAELIKLAQNLRNQKLALIERDV
jgi:uncharacterized FlaG/YvyC family protein